MSEYGGAIYLGFGACVPKGLIPDWLYFSLICPPSDANKDGSAEVAPCGTRKVEAALLDHGFRRKDVIVAHPEYLDRVVGSRTKVVGITENDPLGIGPATSTFTQIFGGEAYMAIKFRELLKHPSIGRRRPKTIVGGPGAWQLEDKEVREKLGIDCVVIGEGERVVGSLFEKAVNDEELPGVVNGETTYVDEIPVIRGAAVDGIVEIARGCGRGCDFCVPTLQRYRCLPLGHILKEVEVNLRADRQPMLHAEDVLRYGAKGIEVNTEAVISLFRSVKNHPGVKSVRMSHFALSSVAAAPDVIEEVSSILEPTEERWLSGQTGIETGSPRLMSKHMRGKCKPFAPEEWPDVVLNAFEILSENNWVPCTTLILGLPEETDKDLEITISLVENLRSFKSLLVPLFLVATGALGSKCHSFTLDQLTPKHSELLLKCWQHTLRWMTALFKEWAEMSIRNRIVRRGLSTMFSYGVRRTESLIRVCERDYSYDLRAMIEDSRSGAKVFPAPLPVRLLKPLLRIGDRIPSMNFRSWS
jgi:radical SAM superfamily enzyme YgiQ (UPF0313 family)